MPLKQKISIFIVLLILVLLSTATFISYNYESKQILTISPTPTIGQVKSAIIEDVEKTFLVTRIIDGDTFEIETKQKVRLIGIDTPELNTANKKPIDCFAKEAKEKLSNLILDKQVTLIKDISDTDRYGRLLRYVYVEDLFINKILVQEGFAYAVTYPPDVKYKNIFINAQKSASVNSRGLWSTCH